MTYWSEVHLPARPVCSDPKLECMTHYLSDSGLGACNPQLVHGPAASASLDAESRPHPGCTESEPTFQHDSRVIPLHISVFKTLCQNTQNEVHYTRNTHTRQISHSPVQDSLVVRRLNSGSSLGPLRPSSVFCSVVCVYITPYIYAHTCIRKLFVIVFPYAF